MVGLASLPTLEGPALGGLTLRGRTLAALTLAILFASTSATAQESLKGPDVTISSNDEETVYEYRQNGVLRIIRVVPAIGAPYYLVPADPSKGGDLERSDTLLPSWVILRF